MSREFAEYKCRSYANLKGKCDKLFKIPTPTKKAPPSGSSCLYCGHIYVKWLNFEEWV